MDTAVVYWTGKVGIHRVLPRFEMATLGVGLVLVFTRFYDETWT